MKDTAAFKFDSLPGVTFVVTRHTKAIDQRSEGWLEFSSYRDGEKRLSGSGQTGPTAPPSLDMPFVPGGKVPFIFRSLPGYTFYAARSTRDVEVRDQGGGITRWMEGWVQLTYRVDGDDEERPLGGFEGPRT